MNQLCFPMEDSKRKTLQKDVQVINRKMHTTLNNHGCVDDQVHTSSLFFPFVFSGITCMGGENWLSKKKAKLPLQKKKNNPENLNYATMTGSQDLHSQLTLIVARQSVKKLLHDR